MPVQRFEDLISYLITKAAPGQTVTLSVLRNDEPLELPVTLGTAACDGRCPVRWAQCPALDSA